MEVIWFEHPQEILTFPKFQGCSSKIVSATPFWILRFKGAWQAPFLSHNLATLKKYVFSIGDQMILVSFFYIPNPNPVIFEKPILAVYSRPQHGNFTHVAA